MRLKALAAPLLAVLLLTAVVACSSGGSSGGDAATDASTTTTEGDGGSSPSLSLPSSEDLEGMADAEDLLGGLLGEGCLAASSYLLMAGLGGFAAFGGLTEADIAEYRQNLEELGSQLPSELRDDIEVVSAAYGEFFTALGQVPEGANIFDPAVSSQFEEAGKALETSEFEEANQRITTWIEERCDPAR